MIAKSSDISALHGFSLVSLMHMGIFVGNRVECEI